MSVIFFENVKWKNFLSTGNSFTEVDLNRHANVLIVGENGAGKSTILDALHFALYGKPFRRVKKDQLINSVNRREALVEVTFKVNNKQYRVVRGLKPNIFEIYEDSLLLDQHAATKDSQEHLENNILRLNSKSFSQIIILGSSAFVPFMQLTTGVRREVIEDLLDIRIFSTMQSLLKEHISANKDDIVLNKKDIDSIQEIIQIRERQITQEKDLTNDRIITHNKRISELYSSITEIEKEIETCNHDVKIMLDNIADESINDAVIANTATIKNNLKAKKIKYETAIEFYKETQTCPTCTQEIDAAFREETIAMKLKIISQIETALVELQESIVRSDDRYHEIVAVHNEISKIQKRVTISQNEIYKDLREIGVISNEVEHIQAQIQKGDNSAEMRELYERREGYYTKKEEHLNSREVFEMANIILRDSGIKSRIIKQYIPIINSLVNKYLAAMDFFVKFELDENFEEKILSRHRDEFTYESFSEGEKMRIDLSLLFTWRAIARMKNSAATNLLILDEVFDASLDANGCEEFLKLMQSLEDANVFVISHKGDIMQDKFRSTIRFEKHKNFSRIAA